jgi:hypothetical protein
MGDKKTIHDLIHRTTLELLAFIKSRERMHPDRWVPAPEIKQTLDLDFPAVPKAGKQYGKKGWLFAIYARMLEDQNKLAYRKVGGRAFYRSI